MKCNQCDQVKFTIRGKCQGCDPDTHVRYGQRLYEMEKMSRRFEEETGVKPLDDWTKFEAFLEREAPLDPTFMQAFKDQL